MELNVLLNFKPILFNNKELFLNCDDIQRMNNAYTLIYASEHNPHRQYPNRSKKKQTVLSITKGLRISKRVQ